MICFFVTNLISFSISYNRLLSIIKKFLIDEFENEIDT